MSASDHTPTQKVLAAIHAERVRQDEKWGEQNHNPAIWYAILGEEFGEVGKEICEHDAYATGLLRQVGHDGEENARLGEQVRNSPHLKNLQKELIQTAAVAVAMLESLERKQGVALPYPEVGRRVRVIGPDWSGAVWHDGDTGVVLHGPDEDGDFCVALEEMPGGAAQNAFPLTSLEVLS